MRNAAEERAKSWELKMKKIKIAGDLKKRGFKDELIAGITWLSEQTVIAL